MEVTIIHLSDLHFKNDTENRYRLKKLCEDIASIPMGSNVVTAFTGDLVQSGEQEQYEILFELLLAPLITANHNIVLVPGNHDIQRSSTDPAKALELLNDHASSYLFSGNSLVSWPDQTGLIKPLHNYMELEELFHPYVERNYYGYFKQVENLSIVGMNSAWLSHSWSDGGSDRGRLRVEPFILQKYVEKLPKNSMKVLLLHHPFDWLEEKTRDAVISLATEHFDFVLFGHVHTADMTSLIRNESGASFIQSPPLRADWSKGTNGYALIRCDTEAKAVEISYRSYSKSRRNFVIGEDFGANGTAYPTERDNKHFQHAPSRSSLTQRFQARSPHDYVDWHRRNIGAKSNYIGSFITPEIEQITFDGDEQNIETPELLPKLFRKQSRDQFVIAPGDSGLSTSAFLTLKGISEHVVDTGTIPVFFDADKNSINRASILRSMVQTCLVQYSSTEMEHLAKEGSVRLIVDGLNLSNADNFNLFRNTMEQYFPKTRIVAFIRTEKVGQSITSRNNPSLSFVNDDIFQLAEMRVEQIREIITMQDKNFSEDITAQLASNAVECLSQINEPVFPSTVAVLVETLVQDHDFRPINKVRLLDRYVECLLGRFELEDVREGTFSSHDKIELLSYIARIILDLDTPGLTEEAWKETITDYENNYLIEIPKDIISEFEDKGLLVSNHGQITFRADYLFSYFIARQMKSDASFAKKLIRDKGIYRHDSEIRYYGELEGTDIAAVLEQMYDQIEELEIKLLKQYSKDGVDLKTEWKRTVDENAAEAVAVIEELQKLDNANPDPQVADLNDNSKLANVLRRRGIAKRQDVAETEARLLVAMKLYGHLLRNATHIDGQSKLKHLAQLYKAAEIWVGFMCACREEIGLSPVTIAGGVRFINREALIDKVKSINEFKYNAPNTISRILAETVRNPQLSVALRNVLPKLSVMGCLFVQEVFLYLPSQENRKWYLKSIEKSDDTTLQRAALRTLKRHFVGSGRNLELKKHTSEIVDGIRKILGEKVIGNPNTLDKQRLVQNLKNKAAEKKREAKL